MLDDPNRMDGHTVNESIYELIRGMDSFQRLKTEGLFKDTIRTAELVKTEPYPLPDIWNAFESSKRKTDGFVGHLSQYGLFTAPKLSEIAMTAPGFLSLT